MTTPRDSSRAITQADDLDATSSAIRADIERTRERLGETVEALGAQLNPTHLRQRVKDSVREATIGRVQHMASMTRERINETGRGLAQTIRDNPIPAAVAAAGIGWLLLNSRESRERPALRRAVRRRLADEMPDESYEPYEGRALRTDVGDIADDVREGARDLSERVQETSQRAGERAQDVRERVAERAQEVRERVAERAHEARERIATRARSARRAIADTASGAGRRVREGARTTARAVEDRYDESPIGMGAVALAIGLVVGYTLPSTRGEGRFMGRARDRLVDRTRERVADARERVEGVVDRAMPEVKAAVRDAAREEGLTG